MSYAKPTLGASLSAKPNSMPYCGSGCPSMTCPAA
jgi:hypothetical protein